MAGFSDGFNQGLNLMLSARRLSIYEEQLEDQQKRREAQETPVADLGVEGFAEGTTVEQAEQATTIEQRVAGTEGTRARTELLDRQTQLIDIELSPELQEFAKKERQLILDTRENELAVAKMNTEQAEMFNSAQAGRYVYGSLANLAEELKNNPALMGTASIDVAINHLVDVSYEDVKKGNINIVKGLTPDMGKALNVLNPLVRQIQQNPEMLENLNLGDYNQSLNEVFSMKSRGYIGKRYVAEDGTKGTITGIELDFNSFEVEEQSIKSNKPSAILKGNFTYVDDEGNEYTKTSFVPDISKSVIRETQVGTDAQSISLTDMIDITSSLSTIMMDTITDPSKLPILEMAAAVNEKLEQRLTRTVEGELKFKDAANEQFRINEKALAERIQTDRALISAQKKLGNDDEGASEAISIFLQKGIDITSSIEELSDVEVDDLGFTKGKKHYRLKEGILPNEAIFNSLKSEATLEKELRSGTVYENKPSPTPTRAEAFQFRGIDIQAGESRANYLPKLKEAYPEQDIDVLVDTITLRYKARFPNNPELQDDQLLELLKRTLR